MTKLKLFKIPLPPLEEQKAIVKKVNRLLTLCDQLAAAIGRREGATRDFLRASVREVLEESA